MKQHTLIAVAAVALLASNSARALRVPDSNTTRSRPAATVIGTVLNRDSVRDTKEADKRERKAAKELRKEEREREKAMRKAEQKRAKDARHLERGDD